MPTVGARPTGPSVPPPPTHDSCPPAERSTACSSAITARYTISENHVSCGRPCAWGVQERIQTILEDDITRSGPRQTSIHQPAKALETGVPRSREECHEA